jgi:succinyl-CoA synthetase beta subunit
MNLHEYQSKRLFADYGIPVPRGIPVETAAAAVAAAEELGGDLWVVKAQVHAGGRGKAGGVKLARSTDEVREHAEAMLGIQLVTHQSGPEGLPVNVVYVEEGSEIDRELYLSMLVDREVSRVAFIASAAGGMDIEQVAEETPEKIFTVAIAPDAGLQDYQARQLAFGLGLDKKQMRQFGNLVKRLYKLYQEWIALDAKINIEGNALYRQPELVKMRDISQEDEAEREAAEHDLSYVSLDGNIACMVNGAGLAMATMDIIKLYGGEPANFLDVGGGATSERVIAQGIVAAVKDVGVQVPVVVRLEGTNVDKGRELLKDSGLDIITARDLADAAEKAVAAAA